jgi:hypothetical protein
MSEAQEVVESQEPVSVEAVVENNKESEKADPNNPPSDVIDLQSTLNKLANHKAILDQGTFPGRFSKQVTDCKEFLNDVYKQVFDQLNEHPYVVSLKEQRNETGSSQEK